MNKHHLSDRLHDYASGSIMAAATLCALLTGAIPTFAHPHGANSPFNCNPTLAYPLPALQASSSNHRLGQRIATRAGAPDDTVKRYLRFIRQGIWDHTQQAPQKATTNFWYAYNILSEEFKNRVAGPFEEFRNDWLLRCDLRYTENQIYVYEQVGDAAIVHAPIDMPGCSETGVRFVKLKLEPQGRSWQIDAACPSLNHEACRLRPRRW